MTKRLGEKYVSRKLGLLTICQNKPVGMTSESKSAHQLNKMAVSFCNCFWLMRDWKLGNLANDKEISTVPFRMEKKDYLCR